MDFTFLALKIKNELNLTDKQLGELVGVSYRTIEDCKAKRNFRCIHWQSLQFALTNTHVTN